jgi:hypothetical protein
VPKHGSPEIHFGQVNAAGRPYAGPVKVEGLPSAVVYADSKWGRSWGWVNSAEIRRPTSAHDHKIAKKPTKLAPEWLCTIGHTSQQSPSLSTRATALAPRSVRRPRSNAFDNSLIENGNIGIRRRASAAPDGTAAALTDIDCNRKSQIAHCAKSPICLVFLFIERRRQRECVRLFVQVAPVWRIKDENEAVLSC